MEHLTLEVENEDEREQREREREKRGTLPIFVLQKTGHIPCEIHLVYIFRRFRRNSPPSPPHVHVTLTHGIPGFLWEIIHPLAGFGADTCFIRRMNDVSCSPVSCHFWYEAERAATTGYGYGICIRTGVGREVLGWCVNDFSSRRFSSRGPINSRMRDRLLIASRRKWMEQPRFVAQAFRIDRLESWR